MSHMDPVMADLGAYLRGMEDQEQAAIIKCINAAQLAGISPDEAEWCEDGECNCPECPWRKK